MTKAWRAAFICCHPNQSCPLFNCYLFQIEESKIANRSKTSTECATAIKVFHCPELPAPPISEDSSNIRRSMHNPQISLWYLHISLMTVNLIGCLGLTVVQSGQCIYISAVDISLWPPTTTPAKTTTLAAIWSPLHSGAPGLFLGKPGQKL